MEEKYVYNSPNYESVAYVLFLQTHRLFLKQVNILLIIMWVFECLFYHSNGLSYELSF